MYTSSTLAVFLLLLETEIDQSQVRLMTLTVKTYCCVAILRLISPQRTSQLTTNQQIVGSDVVSLKSDRIVRLKIT